MLRKKMKVAVIGGGPAGLTAAIGCAQKFGKGCVLILEQQPKTGRKLLATGNGRCNISNALVSPDRYHGDTGLIQSVLRHFSPDDMHRFMRSLGVLLRQEADGRLYPHSNQASTILDALRSACHRLGVEELCDCPISSVRKEKGRFLISSPDLTVDAEYVIFATGSQASSQLGANDSGYALLRSLGLSHSPLFAALSPVCTKETFKSLKGVRAKGSVTLLADGKPLRFTEGEIQFTDYGISGICVFELSRAVNEFFLSGTVDGQPCRELKLSADVMSAYTFPELCDYLTGCRPLFSEKYASELLAGALHKRLSAVVAGQCGLSDKICSALSRQDLKKLAHSAKHLLFTPVRSDALKNAQVSAGGFGSEMIDPDTLMARSIKHLYVCGELLDVDGDCGGFNLHFAVGSALLAADSITG